MKRALGMAVLGWMLLASSGCCLLCGPCGNPCGSGGCSQGGCGDMGCGETFYGDWHAAKDPCDACGHWVGNDWEEAYGGQASGGHGYGGAPVAYEEGYEMFEEGTVIDESSQPTPAEGAEEHVRATRKARANRSRR